MKKISIKTVFVITICATLARADEIFPTIDVALEYIKIHPELVPIDNQDYLNPDYSTFYATFVPNRWDRLRTSLWLKRKSAWRPEPFLELLHRLTEKRKKEGVSNKSFRRIEVSQGDHFLIWGNLQGALHSLVLTLEHLREQKIIDNNFKIIAPKYYMLFNGNLIDRSPYSLETLTIVLRLLEMNPARVFYTYGNHEKDGLWQDYDLRSELEYKVAMTQGMFPPYKNDVVPHTDEINDFFSTLPSLVYLIQKTTERNDGIRIGFSDRATFELTFEELTYVLNAENTPVMTMPISLPKERGGEKPGEIYAMFEDFPRSDYIVPNYTSQGLRLLPPDRGTTAWNILSAPTQTYQKLYNFYTDSYADLAIQMPMYKSTLTWNYQEVKNRTGFKAGRVYNIFSGQSEEQFRAITQYAVVRAGTSIDLKGPTSTLGKQIKAGIALAINKQNQLGTIPGTFIALAIFNDDFVITKVRPNIEDLVKNYKTSIIVSPNEYYLLKQYLDLVTKKEILVLFPFNSVAKLHSSEYPNIIHYGPSYIKEADISTRYILETQSPRKIAVIYEDGSIGEDALVGARIAFKDKEYKDYIELPFKSAVLNFKDIIETITRENPDVIGLFCSVATAQEFIRQVGIQNITDKLMYGTSSLGAESFRHFYKERGLRVVATHLVPNPAQSDMQIVKEFQKEAADNFTPLSPQALESYIVGSIFVEALRMIKGPITHESIIKSLESMNNHAFKGLTLTFHKDTREVSRFVWLDDGTSNEWKRFEAKGQKPGVLDEMLKALRPSEDKPKPAEDKKTSWW